jgi:hypothetical protein
MLGQPEYISDERPGYERRSSTRICCAGFAECLAADSHQLFRGEIRSVSETGCFISVRAAVKLAANAIVELRFKLGQTEYTAMARVVETVPSTGIRMRFIATDPALTDRIRRILSMKSPTI